MGSYHVAVNLRKKQFIDPWSFGDTGKLGEFGRAGEGLLLGLAVLLADGNDSGGLYTYGAPAALGPPHDDDRIIEDVPPDGDYRGAQMREPKAYGHWAGDAVVLAGSYAVTPRWLRRCKLTDAETAASLAYYNRELPASDRVADVHKIPLYHVATACFRNISPWVIAGIRRHWPDCPVGNRDKDRVAAGR